MMGGVSGIFVIIFGIVWTILAISMGGGLFALFGVCFVGIAIASTAYNFKNATGKNRYSEFDITEDGEEPDPLNQRFGSAPTEEAEKAPAKFCPYCGTKAENDYAFCSSCGRKLPDGKE